MCVPHQPPKSRGAPLTLNEMDDPVGCWLQPGCWVGEVIWGHHKKRFAKTSNVYIRFLVKPPVLRFGVSGDRLLSRCPARGQISGSGETRQSCAQGHPLPSNTHLPHPAVWERPSGPPSSERPSLNTTDLCLEFTCSAGQSNQQQKNEWAQESLLSAGSLRVWVSGLPFVLRICSETRQEHKQKHTGILMGILTTSLFLSWVYISSALIF